MENNKIKTKGIKKEMSQLYTDEGYVKPFTLIEIKDEEFDFGTIKENDEVMISSTSKGKGFAGGMKRWGFSGGPATHGSLVGRRIGSIGAQGYGRVLKGKKMPGRMGGKKITMMVKVLDVDVVNKSLKINGSIPGGYNAPITVHIINNTK